MAATIDPDLGIVITNSHTEQSVRRLFRLGVSRPGDSYKQLAVAKAIEEAALLLARFCPPCGETKDAIDHLLLARHKAATAMGLIDPSRI